MLLFRGADREVQNFANQSAFQVAVISNNTELAAIIQKFNDNDVGKWTGLADWERINSEK